MRLRHSLALFALLLTSSPICLAADPVSLLLKALGPLPLSYNRPQPAPYETYQNASHLLTRPAPKHPVVQNFVYDPVKFDDLTARYMLCQANREQNAGQLLHSSYDELAVTGTMDKVLKEYLRRIYQGYAMATTDESLKKRYSSRESAFDMAKNMLVNYQAFRLSSGLEARVGYDVIGNSSHLKLVSRILEGELTYFAVDRKSPAALPEHIERIDEAMDQFAQYDRMSVSVAHTFSDLGLRVKTKYGINNGALDYGFSKALFGPLALQLMREDNFQQLAPGFMAVQLTLGKRF